LQLHCLCEKGYCQSLNNKLESSWMPVKEKCLMPEKKGIC